LTDTTDNEKKLYGETWNEVYGGYFADPGIAAPLVEAILQAAEESSPAVIADLGGGTGFILSQIEAQVGRRADTALVCVDKAREQLDDCPGSIKTLQSSIEALRRSSLVSDGDALLLCMRSVLHYFGHEGLCLQLEMLRSVLEDGEYFVHQTICFDEEPDRDAANLVYELMGTGKWYPTIAELADDVSAQGFEVARTAPARTLPISSGELEHRYGVSPRAMAMIRLALEESCGEERRVYVPGPYGFTLNLDYVVMTCRAVS
jgi:hypothetical protein